jgi:hypothetical protein
MPAVPSQSSNIVRRLSASTRIVIHGIFDFAGGAASLSCDLSDRADQRPGDMIVIAPAFFDRMRWHEPLAMGIDQQARQ